MDTHIPSLQIYSYMNNPKKLALLPKFHARTLTAALFMIMKDLEPNFTAHRKKITDILEHV
jgi:hypothetical protein